MVSGHEHMGGVGEDLHSDSGHSAYIEGCVLQSDTPTGRLVVQRGNPEPRRRNLSVHQIPMVDRASIQRDGRRSWSDFRSLPKKSHNQFHVTEPFARLLSDPGGVFESKGSPLTLADLYVYPDMQETAGRAEQRRILSTSVLEDVTRLDGGVLLTGEEKVGATSPLL